MVETSEDQAGQSTIDTVDDGKVEERVDGEQEIVAPWQEEQQQESQPVEEKSEEGTGEGGGDATVDAAVDHAESKVDSEIQEDTAQIDPFAGLGSVDDIAAAALQAADLSALFGGSSEAEMVINEPAGDTIRGVKRSHDDMSMDPEEASMLEQFSTIAPETVKESEVEEKNKSAALVADAPPPPSTESAATSDPVAPMANGVSTQPQSTEDKSATATTSVSEPVAVSAPIEQASEAADVGFSLGSLDLQAVAQAAMGLDAEGNPLPGNEESHRALADAVKQLSAAQGITLPSSKSGDESSDNGGNGPSKRFQCTQCERAFARAYNLNTHLATHDPDPARSKPFPCPYPSCKSDGGRSFSRKHDLQRHVASTHENEPEPVTSTVGENGMRQTGGLASLGLGMPGRKFRCDDCGRAFVRRDALKRHQCTRTMDSSPGTMSAMPTMPEKPTPDYYSNAAAGLSLYTSNVGSGQSSLHQQQGAARGSESVAGSSYDSDPFGPNGITYEHLSQEVQDMAMQLVAQAQSYNEQKSDDPPTSSSAPLSSQSSAPIQPPPPPSSIASQPVAVKSEIKTEVPSAVRPTTNVATSATPASSLTPSNPTTDIKVEPIKQESLSTATHTSPITTTSAPPTDPISAQ